MTASNDSNAVRESIRQIDANSWLIGGRLHLVRTDEPRSPRFSASWSDGQGSFFALAKSEAATDITIPTTSLAPDGPVQLVHDAGDANAAWRIGEAYCKVQISHCARRTREHTTLEYLHDPDESRLDFPIPRVIHHAEFDGRYYLIISALPGQTLQKMWPEMSETNKQFCVDRLVNICKQLISRGGHGTAICGIDTGYLRETWLGLPDDDVEDLSPQVQRANCQTLGMDCSDLVFHHCDLGPHNVIVDLTRMDENTVGIIDWEVAGFVPRDWIRTKFCVCFAMDFDLADDKDGKRSRDWRERVQVRLGEEGFQDVRQAWVTRWKKYGENQT